MNQRRAILACLLSVVLGIAYAGGGCANGGDSSATGDDSGLGDDVTVDDGGDGAMACTAPKTACGATCTNIKNDPKNCGKCGLSCATSQVCNLGTCETSCSPPQTLCGGPPDAGGVDGASDAAGDAGHDAGAVDAGSGDGGIVQPYCANLGTDGDNCGACGHVCPPSHTCNGGQCGLSCPPGQRACVAGNVCIPQTTCCSSADCPVTGEICPQPGGACQCPSGEKICNTTNSCIGSNNCCTNADCTVTGSTCQNPGQACVCMGGTKACLAENKCIASGWCCDSADCGPEPNVGSYSCSTTTGACSIAACNSGCYDVNGVYSDGCECCDDALGKSCGAATGKGLLAVGQSVSVTGDLPAAGESDWVQVTFSGEGNKAFHAHIFFTSNPGNVFAFDLASSCTPLTPLPCTEGGACTGKNDWEIFYGAQATGNPGDPGWQAIPAVNSVWVRVYRVTGSPTCDQYALTISE